MCASLIVYASVCVFLCVCVPVYSSISLHVLVCATIYLCFCLCVPFSVSCVSVYSLCIFVSVSLSLCLCFSIYMCVCVSLFSPLVFLLLDAPAFLKGHPDKVTEKESFRPFSQGCWVIPIIHLFCQHHIPSGLELRRALASSSFASMCGHIYRPSVLFQQH